MDKERLYCPHCGAKLVMYECFEEYRDEETLMLTEHYECQNCRGDIEKSERLATYQLVKEAWQ